MSTQIRYWYFSVEDFNGDLFFINSNAEEIGEEEAKLNCFIGTEKEAQFEADKRGDLYEDKYNCCLDRVTLISNGIVK